MSEDEVARRHIAVLEHEGVSEAEVGTWTLDEEAARRKLAEYRLVDAARWLCMIVEVATLLGASTIELEPSFGELPCVIVSITGEDEAGVMIVMLARA